MPLTHLRQSPLHLPILSSSAIRPSWCMMLHAPTVGRGFNPLSNQLKSQAPPTVVLSRMAPPSALQKQHMSSGSKLKKEFAEPRPSASILLVSPFNEILLLHRVKNSRSFPAAHVFPGGNLSEQDGEIPWPDDPQRHQDGHVYRLGAVRECFEESGILLARRNDGSGEFLDVAEDERERGRKEVHAGKLRFSDWVASQDGIVDTNCLIPFTRWITPTILPRRFTTQMYLAFLPLSPSDASTLGTTHLPTSSERIVHKPTPDGGLEHTAAQFLPCAEWLRLARANDIILLEPQFFLIHILSQFLAVPLLTSPKRLSIPELQKQRDALVEFIRSDIDESGIKWADKVISPRRLLLRDGRSILLLDKPGPELDGSGRGGDWDRVVLVRSEDSTRNLEVRLRKEVLAEAEAKAGKEKL